MSASKIRSFFIQLFVFIAFLMSGCHTADSTPPAEYLLKDAWDGRNNPSIFGNLKTLSYDHIAHADFLQGSLEQAPWSDTYWPLFRGGMAWRWSWPGSNQYPDLNPELEDVYVADSHEKIAEFMAINRNAKPIDWLFFSTAEKYDRLFGYNDWPSADYTDNFPFTRSELAHLVSNTKRYFDNKISWGWMGHCHGWAIASLIVPRPKNAVNAINPKGESVIFTQGDLRGLTTKAFSENSLSSSQQFLGTRCDVKSDEIVRDDHGRIVDGLLGAWNSADKTFTPDEHIAIELNNWTAEGHADARQNDNIIVFRSSNNDSLHWLVAKSWLDSRHEIAEVEIREVDRDAMARGENIFDRRKPHRTAHFKYLKNCRDLNPGAFHIVLSRLLSEAARKQTGHTYGFVADITHSDQVWNQPVFAYESRVGALTPVNTDANKTLDVFRAFRAPGTEYLVHVVTQIKYGIENGPLPSYKAEDEHHGTKLYQYTLELDKAKNIIGGEWHGSISVESTTTSTLPDPLSGTQLLKRLRDISLKDSYVEHPDFLWRFAEDTKVLSTCRNSFANGCINATVLYKLLACSQSETTSQIKIGDTDVTAVDCGQVLRP